MSVRPESACCTHRPPQGDQAWRQADCGRGCWACLDKLVDWLAEIVERYDKLSASPGSPPENRRAPGFGSQAPCNLHVIAATDLRNHQVTEPGDVLSIPGELSELATRLVEERELNPTPPHTVKSLCGLLSTNMEWLFHQGWVEHLHTQLAEIRQMLRGMTGEPQPPIVGRCIEIVDDTTLQRCGHPLRGTPPWSCHGCGSFYTGERILRMQYVNRQESADVLHPVPGGVPDGR